MRDFWSYFASWLGLWLGVVYKPLTTALGKFFAGNDEFLRNLINPSPLRQILPNAFISAQRLSNFIFGDRLFYGWGFVSSIAFSVVAGTIFVFIAWATNPFIRLHLNFAPYGATADDHLRFFGNILTIALAFISFVLEYFYVAKSRLLLRYINHANSAWKAIAIFILDIASTVTIFILVTPLILVTASKSLGLFFSNIQGPEIAVNVAKINDGSWLQGHTLLITNGTITDAYEISVIEFFKDVMYHFEHPLQPYHTFVIYRRLYFPQEFQPATCKHDFREPIRDLKEIMGCAFHWQGMTYFTTTMLATSLATSMWILLCVALFVTLKLLISTFTFCQTILLSAYADPAATKMVWAIFYTAIVIISGLLINYYGSGVVQ
jgi:hypothetical protein